MCNDFITGVTAAIACRELGYYDTVKGEVASLGHFDIILPSIPIILDNLKCGGHEISLLNCSYNDFNVHDCVDYEDVVLECKVHECNNTNIRLVNGRNALDG